MKSCIRCNEAIANTCIFCPKCGKKQLAKISERKDNLITIDIHDEKNPLPQPLHPPIHEIIEEKEDGIFFRGVNANDLVDEQVTFCREFRGQDHFRPKDGVRYWIEDKPRYKRSQSEEKKKEEKKVITILIPFYNEEASDLMMTITTLYENFASLKKLEFDIHILLVMDGWWKASESMKEKMKELFPANGDVKPWWEYMRPIKDTDDMSKCVSTFIIQRVNNFGSIEPIEIEEDRSVKISLIAKRDNRKKINAHDWMLTSFAKHYNAEFVFLTDCGTLFENDCLTLLVKELLKRHDCVAVSGRQRVMTAEQQRCEDECFFGVDACFRAAQRYDYESSLASYVGAFSLFGMLPVIPGPCGLYRYKTIEEKAVPFYINSVAAHPAECGMLMANLNLAEDRVLTYASVVKTHKNAYTCYVPNAVFYFAAETTPLQLFQQRRRWINGTIAGYLWLLSKPEIIIDSKLKCWNKPFIFLLLMCQFIMYLAMMVSPAVFIVSFYWSMQWIQTYIMEQNDNIFTSNLAQFAIIIYTLIYVIFVVKHSNVNQKPPVITWFIYLITFINAIAMLFIMASMIFGLGTIYEDRKEIWLTGVGFSIFDVVIFMIVFSLVGPPIIALLHSVQSFLFMMFSIVQFYLLLPTMVVFIGAFAMSRAWDLSWGNRPSTESSLKATLSSAERQRINEGIRSTGKQIAYGVMACNILIIVILSLLPEYRNTFVIILAFFIFTWSIIQMVFSAIYFVLRGFRMVLRKMSKLCCVNVLGVKKTEWYRSEYV